jgi:hypothetical protein
LSGVRCAIAESEGEAADAQDAAVVAVEEEAIYAIGRDVDIAIVDQAEGRRGDAGGDVGRSGRR